MPVKNSNSKQLRNKKSQSPKNVDWLIKKYGNNCRDIPESALINVGIDVLLPGHTYATVRGTLAAFYNDFEVSQWNIVQNPPKWTDFTGLSVGHFTHNN